MPEIEVLAGGVKRDRFPGPCLDMDCLEPLMVGEWGCSSFSPVVGNRLIVYRCQRDGQTSVKSLTWNNVSRFYDRNSLFRFPGK